MMEYDVFFYEVFKEEEKLLKEYLPPHINAGFTQDTTQEYKDKKPLAKLISIRTHSIISGDWFNKISGVLSRSTGYDHLIHIRDRISCGYLPEYCSRSVAEHTILLILSLLKKFPRQINQFKDFNRNNLTGKEIYGMSLLIVGVGNIGHEIYNLSRNIGMNVKGVDVEKKHKDVDYVEIGKGIKNADVVVSSMNLTKDNLNYFNYDLLKKAKKDLIFINVSRGELSPSSDLLKLIEENHLGGVALDVYNKEFLLRDVLRNKNPSKDKEIKFLIELAKKENVILTPHNAFNTIESIERKAKQTVDQIKEFLDNDKLIWEVPEH